MGVLRTVARRVPFSCAVLAVGATAAIAAPTLPPLAASVLPPAPSCRADAPGLPERTALLPALSKRGTSGAAPRRVAQVRRNNKADVTFFTTRAQDGVEVEAHGGELTFRQHVRPNGSFSLRLEAPGDVVNLDFSSASVTIARGATKLTLSGPQNAEADLQKAQRLLADSPAIRLSRTAAAALMDAEDDSPQAAAVLLSDGLVGVLTGDPGAAGRVAKHLSRHVRAGIRRVMVDCYYSWENSVNLAWTDYEDCLESIDVWNPVRWLCSARWIAMAESYWFQFLSCIGFSGFLQ